MMTVWLNLVLHVVAAGLVMLGLGLEVVWWQPIAGGVGVYLMRLKINVKDYGE